MKEESVVQHQDAEFLGPLRKKNYAEKMEYLREGQNIWREGTYRILQSARAIELTGDYTTGNYETFEEWLKKETPFTLGIYYKYLKIAWSFTKELIFRAGGIPAFRQIRSSQLKDPEYPKVVVGKIEHEEEVNPKHPDYRRVLKELAERGAKVPNPNRPGNKLAQLALKLNQKTKRISQLEAENESLKTKLGKYEMTIDDLKAQIKEFQTGKRMM